MSNIHERYNGKFIAVNTTYTILSQGLGGFLVKTDGTITVVNAKGVTVVSAHPVTAGTYVPLPLFVGFPNATFATAGGASGTLFL